MDNAASICEQFNCSQEEERFVHLIFDCLDSYPIRLRTRFCKDQGIMSCFILVSQLGRSERNQFINDIIDTASINSSIIESVGFVNNEILLICP